jgi:hypothetical protein
MDILGWASMANGSILPRLYYLPSYDKEMISYIYVLIPFNIFS